MAWRSARCRSRPVTYLGVVSYGTYLWHWPVVVIATHGRHLDPSTLFVLTCTVATALAALSYHVLEHPIRASKWLNQYRVPVVAVGLTISVVGGLVLAPAILETDGVVSARVGAGGKSEKIDFIGGLARADLPDCLGKPVEKCTVVSGNGLRVVLMGDSHARMWIPAFKAIAKDEGWKLSVTALNECPWQRGLRYGQSHEGIRENCLRHQEDWYSRVVPQLKPDIVILTHQAFDEPALPADARPPERTVREEQCLLAVPSEGPRTHGIVRTDPRGGGRQGRDPRADPADSARFRSPRLPLERQAGQGMRLPDQRHADPARVVLPIVG